MKNSILVYLLESFTSNEIKEFDDFICSPFFNKNESVIKLFNYLRKYYPEFPQDKLSKGLVYQKLFPGTDYNDGFMRKIIFQLSHLAEKFLSFIAYNKDPLRVRMDYLTEINNRNLPRIFNKNFPSLEKEVEENKEIDYNYFHNKYTLEVLLISHLNNARYKVDLHDKKISYNEHVILKIEWLEKYFLNLSINAYRYLNYEGYTSSTEYSDEILDRLISFFIDIENSGKYSAVYENNPILKLHICEIMLMKNKASEEGLDKDIYYYKLKDLLKNGISGYRQEYMFSLYNILHQHCNYKMTRGFDGYKYERFDLDKTALEHNIYKTNNEIYFPPPAFAIFVRDASEAGEVQWAEDFINKYRANLDIDNFETVINISNSLIKIYRGEFREALNYLNKIKPVKRWEFKLAVKELTAIIYYELSMISEAYYLVDSFRHFVSKLGAYFPQERVTSRNNFLKYYTKLLKLKEKGSPKASIDIMGDLENSKAAIFSRDWLLEKAKELAGGKEVKQ